MIFKGITIWGQAYKCSNTGRAWKMLNNGDMIEVIPSGSCYKLMSIKGHSFYFHRLIAMAWHPNPKNKPCVNHKDGNEWNNKPSNLEWVTHKENCLHAHGHKDYIK